jgi:hypothetical protein
MLAKRLGNLAVDRELMHSYYPMNGIANMLFHAIYCRLAKREGGIGTNKVSECRQFARQQIEQMANDRAITDGLSLKTLSLYQRSR